MIYEASVQNFKELKACVIIPTYNNVATIKTVIDGVKEYTTDIIVVNDGCTDQSLEILNSIDGIHLVNHAENKGKGIALQTGFKAAVALGYRYAITIDSDGQHFPEDLGVFLEKVKTNPDSIIIGARNMDQASVPGKSNFGNKFSNFWVRLETGVKLPDTQSGYRLYPVQKLKDFYWLTKKYEFEIEVLVRASWAGIPIVSVPVKVFYAPKETRVTHFRPFQDSSRVAVLNTFFVFITFLYIKPRDFLRLFQKKNLKNTINTYLIKPEEKQSVKIASLAFGVFMGIFPVWGFQLIIGFAVCYFLKLNKGLFLIAANISIPPLLPFILYFSHYTGGLILQRQSDIVLSSGFTLNSIHQEMMQYYIGACVFAVAAGLATLVISFLIVKIFPFLGLLKKTASVN
jgi:glycosyltransferase involved in cell wall biosynthesis